MLETIVGDGSNLSHQAKSMGCTIEQDNRGYVSLIRLPKNLPLNLIAELTGKRHADVMRDIRTMLEQIGEGERKFASAYNDAQGKVRECYNLPKNLTLNLITGYRADMRLKIIDRWMELEGQVPPAPQFQLPQTFSEARWSHAQFAMVHKAAWKLYAPHHNQIEYMAMSRTVTFGLILSSLLLPTIAQANCIGSSQFETCQDDNGNSYTVNRVGNQTFVNGTNAQTGHSWNEQTNTIGNQTFVNGTAANGRPWNETETRMGNTTMMNGTDANGRPFSHSCNQFGCQ